MILVVKTHLTPFVVAPQQTKNQRLRRWANTKATLAQCIYIVAAGSVTGLRSYQCTEGGQPCLLTRSLS